MSAHPSFANTPSASPPLASGLAEWVSINSNPDLKSVFRGGTGGGKPSYVCRGSYQGGVHPGRYVPPAKNCYIEYAGSEVVLTNYEVLINYSGIWVAGSGGSIPNGAYVVGSEGGQDFYSCRAFVAGGIELGKIRPVFKACNISLNGAAYLMPVYEVLVNPWTPSTGADVPGELPAGVEAPPDSQVMYVCRGTYQGGIHIGKFRAGIGCVAGYANQGIQIPAFEILTNSFSGVWLAASNGKAPAGAFAAGIEPPNNGLITQYVCRARQGGGTHPGKLISTGCQIQYGFSAPNALQVIAPTYEVLVPTPALPAGPFKIHTQATGRFWEEGADLLIGTATQTDTNFSRYTFVPKPGGTYRVNVVADSKELHQDGCCSKLLSTRYQPDDDYTVFYFEQQADGSYRVRTKADNLYLAEAGGNGGDRLISARTQTEDDYARFLLEPVSAVAATKPPVIVSFSVDKTSIAAGSTATLNWSVTDADSVVIEKGIGQVVPSGSMRVTPNATTTYTLTATNKIGSMNQQVTITVVPISASISVVNGATFKPGPIAADSIATIFGTGLAPQTVTNTSNPPPTTLGGVTVSVIDSKGVRRPAPLFFVSSSQINFAVPAETALGDAQVVIGRPSDTLTAPALFATTTTITAVAPGIFTTQVSSVPAALYHRYSSNLTPIDINMLTFNPNDGSNILIPRNPGDQLYLLLFGTGIRAHSAGGVTATVGGVSVPVQGAVAQGQFIGEDQINLGPFPASVPTGFQFVVVTVDGKVANAVAIVLN